MGGWGGGNLGNSLEEGTIQEDESGVSRDVGELLGPLLKAVVGPPGSGLGAASTSVTMPFNEWLFP